MLTIKQKQLLDYIKDYYKKELLFPTFDEMKNNLSIKSKSGYINYSPVLKKKDL